MPKRKTADATPETVVKAAEPKSRSKSSAMHKLTTTKKAKQPSPVAGTAASEKPAVVTPQKTNVETTTASTQPVAHADIARLAYSYWERRGWSDGSPHEDWLRAERELTEFTQNR